MGENIWWRYLVSRSPRSPWTVRSHRRQQNVCLTSPFFDFFTYFSLYYLYLLYLLYVIIVSGPMFRETFFRIKHSELSLSTSLSLRPSLCVFMFVCLWLHTHFLSVSLLTVLSKLYLSILLQLSLHIVCTILFLGLLHTVILGLVLHTRLRSDLTTHYRSDTCQLRTCPFLLFF